jgi:hypothetical protein
LTGFVAAGLPPATSLSRLENPMLNGEIEYLDRRQKVSRLQ